MTTRIALDYDCYRETTREPNEEDGWDRGNTSTSWYIKGAYIPKDNDFGAHEVEVAENVVPGDTVHCLYAIWSTGDSFGNDDRACMELIDVFTDYEAAAAARDALWANTENDLVQYKRQDGTETQYCRSWFGYFESLDDLEILSTTLQGPKT